MKFISTAGHGYLRVTIKQVNKAIENGYKPSQYSFYNSKVALLEEDGDMLGYLKTMFPDTYKTKFKTIPDTYQNDINRNCYERF